MTEKPTFPSHDDITFLALTGKKGSGKDTYTELFSDILWNNNPPVTILRHQFAEPLKRYCSYMFEWSRDDLEDFDFKEKVDPVWGFSPRQALQAIGENYLKPLNPTFVIDYAQKTIIENIGELSARPVYIIISDMRFELEARWLHDLCEGTRMRHFIFRVDRDTGHSADDHISEHGLDDRWINKVIDNNVHFSAIYDNAYAVLADVLEEISL